MAKVASTPPDDKKLQRIIKNRIAAENHRKKKKEEREEMLERIAVLQATVEHLEKENIQLRKENSQLKSMGTIKSIPSPTLSNQSLDDIFKTPYQYDSEVMNDFRLEDYVDFSGLQQRSLFSIFTVFMFGFASLLLPNFHAEPVEHKLICAPSGLPTIDYFQDNLKDWHQDFVVNPVSSISLPTEKNSVLSFLASKKHPSSSKSLFTTGLSDILPTLIFQPFIRIVPLLSDDHSFDQDGFERLKFSLFAHSSGLGIDGSNGILRLDLQVFKATWMDFGE